MISHVLKVVEKRCRENSIYMLGPEKARFLAGLLEEAGPELVVECGTAIGYSGLHIASVLRQNGRGRLITIEINPKRALEARENFKRAGVGELVEVRIGDAEAILPSVTETVDFLLLDNHFENYFPCFLAIEPRLADGAVIVADNAGIGANTMADYLLWVRSHYESRIYWFDTDLPWAEHDAIEVTIYRS